MWAVPLGFQILDDACLAWAHGPIVQSIPLNGQIAKLIHRFIDEQFPSMLEPLSNYSK